MMSLSSIDRDPVVLAVRVTQAISSAYQIAYVQLAPDLTIVQHSSNFPRLLKDSGQALVDQPITNVLWEFVGMEGVLNDILQGKQPSYRLATVNRELADGSPGYFNFMALPLEPNEPERGLLLLIEDDTAYGRLQQTLVQDRNELRLLQRQLTRANKELHTLNRLKSLFLSMSAHDLRTPLTAISGYASLMLDQVSADALPDVHEYLTIVLIQADRLNRLINDFLDLDQIEEERLVIKTESCDLNDIVEEVTAVLKINAGSRQINLETRLPASPLRLQADREKISRVVYNLVSNAIKYTQREGRVRVQAGQDKGQIVLQVMDNGRGMSEEELSRLFQLYYRTEDARRSKTKGTGLGLYIVKMLVEAHHGRVEVASRPGKGSVFTVYLPQTRQFQKPDTTGTNLRN